MDRQSEYNKNKHDLVLFYKWLKKYNEIQLTKNRMDLHNRKIKKQPPSDVNILFIN